MTLLKQVWASLPFFILFLASPAILPAATLTVDTLDDLVNVDGNCSLREAIQNANEPAGLDTTGGDCAAGEGGGPDIIEFDSALSGGTLVLGGSSLPQITEALTIRGPVPGDAGGITLDGNGSSRILEAIGGSPSAFAVELNDLTLTGGHLIPQGNRGAAARGGNADLILNGVHVTGNATEGQNANGGALFVNDGQLTLNRCLVDDNQAHGQNADGGGLAVEDGNLLLTDTTVTNNQALGQNADGGGVFVDTGEAMVIRSTISGNSTVQDFADGGGLTVEDGNVTLINSTVSGNSTGGQDAFGGGFFIDQGNLTLIHSTVAFNSSVFGTDGVHFVNPADTLTVENSLLVQAEAGETACSKAADAGGGNLATDASCFGAGTPPTEIDLETLADNGGPTLTHALGVNSLARDAAGDCVADHGLSEDQRGAPRPASAACDVGAVEAQDLCGDGFLDPPEECEDGNTENGDGCDSSCKIEVPDDGEDEDDTGEGDEGEKEEDDNGGCALNPAGPGSPGMWLWPTWLGVATWAFRRFR